MFKYNTAVQCDIIIIWTQNCYWDLMSCAAITSSTGRQLLTLWTLRSKFEFSFVAPIHFLQKQWGEVDKISSTFIFCDHVHNSHVHSVLQSINFTRRNSMLITLRALRVNADAQELMTHTCTCTCTCCRLVSGKGLSVSWNNHYWIKIITWNES